MCGDLVFSLRQWNIFQHQFHIHRMQLHVYSQLAYFGQSQLHINGSCAQFVC